MIAIPRVPTYFTRRRRGGLLLYWQIYRQRAQLAGLDRHALRDIGLEADQAQTEARRPPWDAPNHLMR